MMRLVVIALLACACDDGGGGAADAGVDAQRTLTLTVDGPVSVQATRAITVTVTASGTTRKDSFPIGGLPATVDLPAPIQLSAWALQVDGFDSGGQLIGRGSTSVPSGTTDAMVTLAPASMAAGPAPH